MEKMQYCFWCGDILGVYDADPRDVDTCGEPVCEREARKERLG